MTPKIVLNIDHFFFLLELDKETTTHTLVAIHSYKNLLFKETQVF